MAVAALVDTDPGFDVVVAGDFNARPGASAHSAFGAFGFRDLSASLEDWRIDHVFTHRASGLGASRARLVLDGKDGPRVSDHPGVLVELTNVPKDAPTVTRVTGRAKLVLGEWLSLRGSTPPLRWDAGWPGRAVGDEFRLVLTELEGPAVEVKLLRDDSAWMQGANATITPGTSTTIDASF
jgi:hypothetical protein